MMELAGNVVLVIHWIVLRDLLVIIITNSIKIRPFVFRISSIKQVNRKKPSNMVKIEYYARKARKDFASHIRRHVFSLRGFFSKKFWVIKWHCLLGNGRESFEDDSQPGRWLLGKSSKKLKALLGVSEKKLLITISAWRRAERNGFSRLMQKRSVSSEHELFGTLPRKRGWWIKSYCYWRRSLVHHHKRES